MISRALRAILSAALVAMLFTTTGCTSPNALRLKTPQASSTSAETISLKRLSAEQAAALAPILTGEVHTVYPTDTGLARVYGQVANLGQTPYAGVRFDLVSIDTNSETDGESLSVVGSFEIDGGLQPGDIKPFDVQTSEPIGSVKSLKVVVSAIP
jgi:hypothetical protein